jgi:hypothetical protein
MLNKYIRGLMFHKGEGKVPVRITKTHRGSGGMAPLSLNLGTGWGCVWSALFPARFALRERTPVPIELEVGWVPGSSLDVLLKR